MNYHFNDIRGGWVSNILEGAAIYRVYDMVSIHTIT